MVYRGMVSDGRGVCSRKINSYQSFPIKGKCRARMLIDNTTPFLKKKSVCIGALVSELFRLTAMSFPRSD